MSICVLDTDVVIAALDRADAHHGEAARAFERFAAQDCELLLCTVNYAEALVRPAEEERSLRAAVDVIAALGIRPRSPAMPASPPSTNVFSAPSIQLVSGSLPHSLEQSGKRGSRLRPRHLPRKAPPDRSSLVRDKLATKRLKPCSKGNFPVNVFLP